MLQKLVDGLLDAGLIQFGTFGVDPVRLNLHLLPAYPAVLHEAASVLQAVLANVPYERIISTADSVPLGVMCSQSTAIPLVYSRGSDDPTALDLVGAYDVGHPAVLLTNSNRDEPEIRHLVQNAGRVGLNVRTVISVIQTHRVALDQVEQFSLIQLSDLVEQLERSGRLPTGQSRAVQDWIRWLESSG